MRIDALLVERGLAPSRAAAQRLIDAGVVLLDGQPVTRSSQTVAADCCIALRTED
ncbi:MAG: S4 domain-containing protein [Methyloversatilis sp.]|nr:S4 domain-containing protein [Methyloversatilis sp.]